LRYHSKTFNRIHPSKVVFAPRWSVWQLTRYIRHRLDSDEELVDVWVEGEVSAVHISAKGHLYFTLQDSQAKLKCVRWAPRKTPASLEPEETFVPKEGDQVVVRGAVTVYEWGGNYQLNVKALSPLGAGERAAALEQLKARLATEGLFDEQYKKKLPAYAAHIALVTSARGAAVKDLQQVLARRWPLARISVVPTLVQGEEAKLAISGAIGRADALKADLMIVGRGGGSPEDLWGFNTELVARAIFAARTPLISAVGHETDFTLADMVADLRAPTPSAAAELAIPDHREVQTLLRSHRDRLDGVMATRLLSRRQALERLELRLNRAHPRQRLAAIGERLAALNGRLTAACSARLQTCRTRLSRAVAALEALSPLGVLGRGYGLVLDGDGTPSPRAAHFETGDGLEVLMADGSLDCTVDNVRLKPKKELKEGAHDPAAN